MDRIFWNTSATVMLVHVFSHTLAIAFFIFILGVPNCVVNINDVYHGIYWGFLQFICLLLSFIIPPPLSSSWIISGNKNNLHRPLAMLLDCNHFLCMYVEKSFSNKKWPKYD